VIAVSPGALVPDVEIIRGANKMESANRNGHVHYRIAAVGGVNVFYREAGQDSGPVVLLLHGFPSSSRMFRDLIPRLSDAYHVIARTIPPSATALCQTDPRSATPSTTWPTWSTACSSSSESASSRST
jgi:hypothetical protein